MAERLTGVPLCGRSGVYISGRLNLTQLCKRFATASTYTQVTVLPSRYDA